MARYILGRLISLVFVLFVVSLITFLLMHAVPGGPFDLVYARLLLFHLPQRASVLARLWDAVAPGGHLVVQDYDLRTVSVLPDLPSVAEVGRVINAAFSAAGADPQVGARLGHDVRWDRNTKEDDEARQAVDRLLANELNPMITPRLAAARATATSPSGWTAWTPVGEMRTGNEVSTPITVIDRSRSA